VKLLAQEITVKGRAQIKRQLSHTDTKIVFTKAGKTLSGTNERQMISVSVRINKSETGFEIFFRLIYQIINNPKRRGKSKAICLYNRK
jgi:hypothetical protein